MELILFRHIYAVKKFSKLFGDIISNDKKECNQSDYIDFDDNTIPYYNNKGISIENDIEVYDDGSYSWDQRINVDCNNIDQDSINIRSLFRNEEFNVSINFY